MVRIVAIAAALFILFYGARYIHYRLEIKYIDEIMHMDTPTLRKMEAIYVNLKNNVAIEYPNERSTASAEHVYIMALRNISADDEIHIESGVNLLKIAADQGSARAMDLLGFLYDKAIAGGKQDIDTAFYWFSKAAEAGSIAGNQYVCKYYVLKKNFKLAAPYCTVSANQGIPMSQAIIGEMYYRGQGVPEDKKLGVNYLCRAVAGGRQIGNTVMKYGMNCSSNSGVYEP